MWACVCGASGEGLLLLNQSKYSFDVEGDAISMTVLRTPVFADHGGQRDLYSEHMDLGVHEFAYMLRPYAGFADAEKQAMVFNMPPSHVMETYHRGELPTELEGISVSADTVVAVALKLAEEENGYILRCYETAGTPAQANISLPILNRAFTASFGANEIKSFFLPKDASMEVKETDLLERPLA